MKQGNTKKIVEGVTNAGDEQAIQETIAKEMAKAKAIINVVVKAFEAGMTPIAGPSN